MDGSPGAVVTERGLLAHLLRVALVTGLIGAALAVGAVWLVITVGDREEAVRGAKFTEAACAKSAAASAERLSCSTLRIIDLDRPGRDRGNVAIGVERGNGNGTPVLRIVLIGKEGSPAGMRRLKPLGQRVLRVAEAASGSTEGTWRALQAIKATVSEGNVCVVFRGAGALSGELTECEDGSIMGSLSTTGG